LFLVAYIAVFGVAAVGGIIGILMPQSDIEETACFIQAPVKVNR
jgi:hypothetical protein